MKKQLLLSLSIMHGIAMVAQTPVQLSPAIHGPLKHLDVNPNYFTDNTGKAIFLTGSHTWENFQDITSEENLSKFDWKEYLDMMESKHHNFMRSWIWEHAYGTAWSTMQGTMQQNGGMC